MLNSFDHQAMLENVNEAKNNLLQLCAGELAEFGFEPKVRGQAVYRTTATGKWAFHLNFRDRVYGFEVMASVAVRLDEVEDLVNHYPLNDLLSNSDRKKTFTVGTNFRVGGAPPRCGRLSLTTKRRRLQIPSQVLLSRRGYLFLKSIQHLKERLRL